jgi:hypothetical protein
VANKLGTEVFEDSSLLRRGAEDDEEKEMLVTSISSYILDGLVDFE